MSPPLGGRYRPPTTDPLLVRQALSPTELITPLAGSWSRKLSNYPSSMNDTGWAIVMKRFGTRGGWGRIEPTTVTPRLPTVPIAPVMRFTGV